MKNKINVFMGKIFIKLSQKGIFKYMPDEKFLKIMYRARMYKKLNFNNPETFSEKLQWLKLYDRKDIYTTMVDKYEAKKYIADKVGEEYIIPNIGIWDDFNEIDFTKLPNKFVLKVTHDSGGVLICKNKKEFNVQEARKKINKSLKSNYYYRSREWPYKNVKPRIIAEVYMEDNTDKQLLDYKVLCFDGVAKCSFVCSNRNSEKGLNVDFYDINWNHMPFERKYKNSENIIKKPINYNKMIEIAERISENISFLRVDFYEIHGKLYIGELTFYPGSGMEEFRPEKYDKLFGDWLDLPTKKEKKHE